MATFTLATVRVNKGFEPAICVAGHIYLLVSVPRLPPVLQKKTVRELLSVWDDCFPHLAELADKIASQPDQFSNSLIPASAEYDTPIRFPNKVLCVGANYADHLREIGLPPEKMNPMVYFSRPPTTNLVGPGKTVRMPRSTHQLDWEVELVIVIGRKIRHATLEEASSAIAGFSVGLDLSCRDIQMVKTFGMDVSRGKAQDTLAPVGPVFVPKDFVQNYKHAAIKLFVNDQKMVDATTSDMLYSPDEQLVEISKYTTLEPGDMVFTGAPAGTATAHGNRWLQVGDQIRAEIEGVGVLEVEVVEDD